MKKILALILVSLSALGLTATIYANPSGLSPKITLDFDPLKQSNYPSQDADAAWAKLLFGSGYLTEHTVGLSELLVFENGIFKYQGRTLDPSNIPGQEIEYQIGFLGPIVLDFDPFKQSNYPSQDADAAWAKLLFGSGYLTEYTVELSDMLLFEDGIFKYQGRTLDPSNIPGQEIEYQIGFYVSELFEDLRPAINGQENFASNVDSPTTVQQMISQLRAIDDIDGDISHKIVIEKDNFTANKNILGRYDVDVSVTDTAGNKTEFKFWVTVADITSPVASADLTPKVISYDKTLDFESLKNTITATDNYYNFSELTITMTRDTYTANKTKLGTYYVDYTVEDPSANKTVLTFPIVVKDLVAPVINGITDLVKSYTNIMPLSEILSGITATDAIDGNLTNEITVISDTYTGNANKPGNYVVTIQVADNAGNKTTRDIKIKVIDDKGADWYIVNNVTFNLPSDTPMTRAQIIDLLTRAGQVQASSLSRVIYSADTYTGNETEPGIYTLAFKVQEPNGNEKAYTYAINVFSTSDEDIDVVPTPPNFIDKSKQFLNENKVSIIAGAVFLALSAFVIVKVKEEVKKNKRKRK